MKERVRFVTDWERDLYSMVKLCERYGVSRKTGYKWVDRYEQEGPAGLSERSRAPHHCPHRITDDVAAAICAGRATASQLRPREESAGATHRDAAAEPGPWSPARDGGARAHNHLDRKAVLIDGQQCSSGDATEGNCRRCGRIVGDLSLPGEPW